MAKFRVIEDNTHVSEGQWKIQSVQVSEEFALNSSRDTEFRLYHQILQARLSFNMKSKSLGAFMPLYIIPAFFQWKRLSGKYLLPAFANLRWTVRDCYFEYLIVGFAYSIIPFDYLIIG